MRATAFATSLSLVIGQLAATPLVAQVTADPRTIPPPGQGGAWSDFAGTIRCSAFNNRERECRVSTQNRVVLLQTDRGLCREGRDWTYNANRIRVRNQCSATFGYGYAYSRPNPPGWGGGNWNDRDFAGTLQCSARTRRQERCYVNTENRVELLQQLSGYCRAGANWGYTSNFIWVRDRCSATFGYGRRYGRPGGNNDNDGPSAGAIIGGVIVAGGLLALLAGSRNKKGGNTSAQYAARGPARIDANLGLISADARPAVQTCLNEAARQVGAVGGTVLRLDSVSNLARDGSQWRFKADTTSILPDGGHKTPLNCRATASKVESLDFNP